MGCDFVNITQLVTLDQPWGLLTVVDVIMESQASLP